MSNKAKKSLIIITAFVVLIGIAAVAYTIYNNKNSPQITYMISTGKEDEKDFYIESRNVGGEVEKEAEENVIAFSEKNYEVFLKMNNEYISPTKIYSDCYVEKGKTYVHYYGTATDKITKQQIKVDETIVFDFVFTNNIVHYSQADRDNLKE